MRNLQLFQKERKLAHLHAQTQDEYNVYFDKKAASHNYTIGPKVWLSDNPLPLGRMQYFIQNGQYHQCQ
jgi:hypothetical protein